MNSGGMRLLFFYFEIYPTGMGRVNGTMRPMSFLYMKSTIFFQKMTLCINFCRLFTSHNKKTSTKSYTIT